MFSFGTAVKGRITLLRIQPFENFVIQLVWKEKKILPSQTVLYKEILSSWYYGSLVTNNSTKT